MLGGPNWGQNKLSCPLIWADVGSNVDIMMCGWACEMPKCASGSKKAPQRKKKCTVGCTLGCEVGSNVGYKVGSVVSGLRCGRSALARDAQV